MRSPGYLAHVRIRAGFTFPKTVNPAPLTVRDEIVKWRQVAIDAKMPREVN